MKLNNNLFKKLLFLLLTFFIILNLCSFSFAATDTSTTYSPTCILMDMDSGKILYNKNAYERSYPASTTKIMTAILTLEHCELTDTAIASHSAIYDVPSGYSNANIIEGEELTIEQLLNVLLIPSANDAAFILAEHIAGSVSNFSDMMNEKALELGCKDTHFVNPNGIHNEDHYSTAYDLALMGQYAMKFDTFRRIVSKTSYSLPATAMYDKDDRLFNTTNDLIRKNTIPSPTNYYYEYATGAKTGYTDAAKSCIVATATKNDVSLIAVVLHSGSTEEGLSQRSLDCKTLFEYGFTSFKMQSITTKESVAKHITVNNGTADSKELDLLCNEDISALIPKDYDLESVIPNIRLTEDIKAPIAEGTILGNITYTIDDIDYSCDLIASHSVFKSNILKTIMELLLILLFLFIVAKFINFRNKRKLRKQSKWKNKRTNSKGKVKKSSSSKRKNNKYISYVDGFYPTYR